MKNLIFALLFLVVVVSVSNAQDNATNIFQTQVAIKKSLNVTGRIVGNGAGLTNVAPRYFTYGFINTTINGTASHLHPSSGAGNTTFNVVAARVPVDTIISDINVRLTYVSHVDTNYFLLFTNGVYTGRSVEVSVSSAANIANSTTSTNVGNTFIPAGTLWALQVTNKSASSRQIYGDWAIRYFAQ